MLASCGAGPYNVENSGEYAKSDTNYCRIAERNQRKIRMVLLRMPMPRLGPVTHHLAIYGELRRTHPSWLNINNYILTIGFAISLILQAL